MLHRSQPFAFLCCCFMVSTLHAADKPAAPTSALTTAPFNYVWAKAYHIPSAYTTDESGYFSLCEGHNKRVYVGCAAYGRDSYLLEFDPTSEAFRVAIDTHKLVGLPLEPTGYAAQSKIHTRDFVGPKTGIIYCGSKQGYPNQEEKAKLEKHEPIPLYKGGYVMVYDPATDTAKNFGMPMPWGDPRLGEGETEGQGVIDVAADEDRNLIYVITCEDQHWMIYDLNHQEKGYREMQPGLKLKDQPNTLIDKQGRACAIAEDWKVARYDPATDKVTVDELMLDGKPLRELLADETLERGTKTVVRKIVHPDWRLAPDGVTAYMQTLNDLRMFKVDLSGPTGQPVQAKSLGDRLVSKDPNHPIKDPDSRGSITIAPDGRVYSMVGVDNTTGFGAGKLHHVVRYDPKTEKMDDLGVIAVKNPDFFGKPLGLPGGAKDDQGKSIHWTHGYHLLPDGTLTILHVHMALIAASDGTLWATTIYPFTLLKIDASTLH